MKDGGLEPEVDEITHISACKHDNNKISTAIPTLSMLSNATGLPFVGVSEQSKTWNLK